MMKTLTHLSVHRSRLASISGDVASNITHSLGQYHQITAQLVNSCHLLPVHTLPDRQRQWTTD